MLKRLVQSGGTIPIPTFLHLRKHHGEAAVSSGPTTLPPAPDIRDWLKLGGGGGSLMTHQKVNCLRKQG